MLLNEQMQAFIQLAKDLAALKKLKNEQGEEFINLSAKVIEQFKFIEDNTFITPKDADLEAQFAQLLDKTAPHSIFSSVAQLITSSDFKDSEATHLILKSLLNSYSHLNNELQNKLYHQFCTHIRSAYLKDDNGTKTLKHENYTFISRDNSDLLSEKSTDILKAAKALREQAEQAYLQFQPTLQDVENKLEAARLAAEADEMSDDDDYASVESEFNQINERAQELKKAYLEADARVKLSRERKIEIIMVPLEIVKAMNPVQRAQKIKQDYDETVVRVTKLFNEQQKIVNAAAVPINIIEAELSNIKRNRLFSDRNETDLDMGEMKVRENTFIEQLVTLNNQLAIEQKKLSIVRESVDRIKLIEDTKANAEIRAEHQKKLDEINQTRASDFDRKEPSVALGQISCAVGSIEENTDEIIKEIKAAFARGVKSIMFGELAITGYLPGDLLFHDEFFERSNQALQRIIAVVNELNNNKNNKSITVHVGHPQRDEGIERVGGKYAQKIFNAYSVISPEGIFVHYKNFLAVDSVFDDARYFEVYQNTEHLERTDPIPAFVLEGKSTKVKDQLEKLAREFHEGRRRIPTLTLHEGKLVWNRVCEEVWHEIDTKELEYIKLAGAESVFVINGSPYAEDKFESRYRVIGDRVKETRLPHVYMNLGGGHVNLCYGGGSFIANAVADSNGDVHPEFEQAAPHFQDGVFDVYMTKTDAGIKFKSQKLYNQLMGDFYKAYRNYESLVKSMRDHFKKARLGHAILGLSGGADSSIVASIARDALERDQLDQSNVTAIAMPSIYTDPMSNVDALIECQLLGINFELIFIDEIDDAFKHSVAPYTKELEKQYQENAENLGIIAAENAVKKYCKDNEGAESTDEAAKEVYKTAFEARAKVYLEWRAGAKKLALENMGATIRQHNILHYFSALMSAANLATSNKPEVVTGYYTYKDMWGALALIGDVSKEGVYAMLAEKQQYIPLQVIAREPSAELEKGQKDQDSLPPYAVVDKIIRLYFDEKLSPIDIALYMTHAWDQRSNFKCDLTMVNKVIRSSQICRFKQIVGTHISAMSSTSQDSGARYPTTSGYINMVSLKKLQQKIDTIMSAFEDAPVTENNSALDAMVADVEEEMQGMGMVPANAINIDVNNNDIPEDAEMHLLKSKLQEAKQQLNAVNPSLLSKMQEYPKGEAPCKEYSIFEYHFSKCFEHMFAKVEHAFRHANRTEVAGVVNAKVQKMREGFLMECLKGKTPAALRKPQRTIFYGCSTNPPTNAHVAIVDYLQKTNPDAKIILAPVFDHVYGKPDMEAFSERCRMSRKAFEGLAEPGRIQVSEIEQRACERANKQVGTYVVLGNLIREEHLTDDNKPEIILGADTFIDFFSGKWYSADLILDTCAKIHIFDRAGSQVVNPYEIVTKAIQECVQDADKNKARLERLFKIQEKLETGYSCELVYHEEVIQDPLILEASSTLARESLEGAQKYTPKAVYDYIRDKNLYASVRARFAATQSLIAQSTVEFMNGAVTAGHAAFVPRAYYASQEAFKAKTTADLAKASNAVTSVQQSYTIYRNLKANKQDDTNANANMNKKRGFESLNNDTSGNNNNNNNNGSSSKSPTLQRGSTLVFGNTRKKKK